MVREINRDVFSLARPSEKATPLDAGVIRDLKDTLAAHSAGCVGMAANMIGVHKRIIIINVGIANMVLVNPVIVKKAKPFTTEEGCLSLEGVRSTKRWRRIEVEFEDEAFKKQRRTFEGFTAQIIQHEIDHCEGVII